MNISEGTLAYSVPAERSEAFRLAIEALVENHGGTVEEHTQCTLSPELRELGLADTINADLVSEGIDTRSLLLDCTDEYLLGLNKVDLQRLRSIILTLADQRLVLAGCTAAPDDVIELLPNQMLYTTARNAGYRSLTQLTKLDVVDLRSVFKGSLSKLQTALIKLRRNWADLHPKRTLDDFRLTEKLRKELEAANIPLDTPVAPLTVQNLHARLCPSQPATSEAKELVQRLAVELERSCHVMPLGDEPSAFQYHNIGVSGGRHKPAL
jgi:hypothetical protein